MKHKEIHTEVYAYGYLFTFAQGDGIRITEVSPHWLYKTTNGQFGEKSKKNEIFGRDSNTVIFNYLIQKVARITCRFELKIKSNLHTVRSTTPIISIGK